jgi:hypothetical protein
VQEERPRVRLRQAVVAAEHLEEVASQLVGSLGLREPFRDPGVALFGLENAVFALGDCFIEIVSPTRPETAAGRYIARRGGDCGYMVMFDLEDLAAARGRARDLGVRTVWEIDLPDISGTHLHPVDMCGAIVSIDGSRPYGSWRWGGPAWTGRVGNGAPGRLTGVTISCREPESVAARWGEILGVPPRAAGADIELDGGAVAFRGVDDPHAEGLTELTVQLPAELRGGRDGFEVAGVSVRLEDLES